jgi:hypothetical protein
MKTPGVHPKSTVSGETNRLRFVELPADEAIVAVLYPRMKDEKTAFCRLLANGKAVRIESAFGTDYVFLSPTPFEFKEGEVTFKGTVGAIQQRGSRVVLSLAEGGRIGFAEKVLESEKAETKQWPSRP